MSEFGMPAMGTAMKGAPLDGDCDAFCDPQTGRHSHGSDDYPTSGSGRVIDMPDYIMRVKQDGIDIYYGEVGLSVPAVTPEACYILAKVLPTLLKDFLESNAKYARAQAGHDLGLKGIIPDINRKTSALITRIWDGQEAGRDSTEEIVRDLVGHLLLMLGKMGVDGGAQ